MRNAFILMAKKTNDFEPDSASYMMDTIGCNFIDEHSYDNLLTTGCFGNKIGKYL